MLTLTRKTDYALIALTHLSQNKETCTSAREIASLYGLPLPLLMNVLKLLGQQGLAKSARGPKGGYQLALPPGQITLHDIILAVEGPIQLVQCIGHESGTPSPGPSDRARRHSADDQAGLGNGFHEVSVAHTGSASPESRATPTDEDSCDCLEDRDDGSIPVETKYAEPNGTAGCELMCTCPVRHPIHRIQSKLVEFVQSVTLADVAEGNGFCQSEDAARTAITS